MAKQALFFIPAPGFILVEPQEEQRALIVVQKEKEPPKKGLVLAVGKVYRTEFNAHLICPVNPGDVILHTTIGYEEFYYENKLYRVIPFTKILGTYDKNSTALIN